MDPLSDDDDIEVGEASAVSDETEKASEEEGAEVVR